MLYIFCKLTEATENHNLRKYSTILQVEVLLLKGTRHDEKVFHFLLESDRPSKMMNICKVGQNFHYFMSYYDFKFSIVLYCYSIVSFAFLNN